MKTGGMFKIVAVTVAMLGVSVRADLASDAMENVDLHAMRDNADTIIVGKLFPIKENIYRMSQYSISVSEAIKGTSTGHDRIIIDNASAWTFGKQILVETNVDYMLFLRRIQRKSIPTNTIQYEPILKWQGVIPLTVGAKERKSIENLEKQYGYKIDSDPQAFRNALKFSVERQRHGWNDPSEHIGTNAVAVYNALHMDKICDGKNDWVMRKYLEITKKRESEEK